MSSLTGECIMMYFKVLFICVLIFIDLLHYDVLWDVECPY